MSEARGKYFVLIILLLLNSISAISQSWDYSYTHFDKLSGLPSDNIYFLCKDKNGFLWIGTDAGLCQYDGSRFKLFTTKDGLPSNDVFELFCDSKNRIWITTMGNEISYFEKDKIFNTKNSAVLKKVVIPDHISRILEGKDGTIWITGFPFTVNRIFENGEVDVQSFYDENNNCYKALLLKDGIQMLTQNYCINYYDSTKKFQISNSKKIKEIRDLCIIDDSTFITTDDQNKVTMEKSSPFNYQFKSSFNVISLFVSNDKIWQLTKNGIKCYSIGNLNSSKMFLRNYSVSNYTSDVYGNAWVGTFNNGLFKINSSKFLNFKPNNSEPSNSIYSIFVEGNRFILGNNNGELSILSKEDYEFCKKVKIDCNSVLSFRILKLILRETKLFVCTDIGLFIYDIQKRQFDKPLEVNTSWKNFYFKSDTLIGLTNTSVHHYVKGKRVRTYLLMDRLYAFTPYHNYKIFGSENALYYEVGDSLKQYPLDQPFHFRIMDLQVADSLLVVATNENGIYFIKDHKIVKNINLSNGLNSNTCAKVLVYKNDLMIATNNGICIYNRNNDDCNKLMESDGLASNNVHDIAIDHDTLYAATDNGLSVIPISSIKSRKTFSFFINPIINFKDTIWDISESMKTHTSYPISLTLNAISLGLKGGVDFFYRVREIDTNYSTSIDQKVKLNFSKPGTYTFEAYSIDINNIKSVPALLSIIVVPYWWQTKLFKGSCILGGFALFALLIFFIARYVRHREQLKNARQNRMWRLELDAWKANINPHFLYNSFNTIQSLFSSEKFQIANEFISNFSDVLRRTIDNSGLLMNPAKDEILYLKKFLDLEKVKRNGRLNYEFELNQPIESYGMIPSLILQPIVENSIKHGPKKPIICQIDISLTQVNDILTIVVNDNGPGFPETQKDFTNSKGLQLVKDKIRIVEQITGKLIDFKLENRYDEHKNCQGVQAIFTMPIFYREDYEGRS